MKILNGTMVYDLTDDGRMPIENTGVTTRPIHDLALLMDGTTSNMDEVHKIAATTTGGVGGSFAAASNYRYLLGRAAPVISEATDNLDANADCIFSPFVGVTWVPINGAATSASTETEGYGSSSMLLTCGAAVDGGARLATVPVAAQPYTCSCRVRANNAGAVGENLRIDYDGTQANVTLTAEWQTLKVTDAAASGVAINADIYFTAGEAGDEVLISMWQRENKLYATPWAYDSRTASTLTFPTASLGLVAAQPFSIVCAVRSPWAGNDSVDHFLLDNIGTGAAQNRIRLVKLGTNNLQLQVYDNAAGSLFSFVTLTAVNWAADTTHIVIATRNAAGVQSCFLDGTAFTNQNAGGGTGLESTLGANTRVGGYAASTAYPLNAPILCAIYNRVLSANEISLLSRMGAWLQKMKGF